MTRNFAGVGIRLRNFRGKVAELLPVHLVHDRRELIELVCRITADAVRGDERGRAILLFERKRDDARDGHFLQWTERGVEPQHLPRHDQDNAPVLDAIAVPGSQKQPSMSAHHILGL